MCSSDLGDVFDSLAYFSSDSILDTNYSNESVFYLKFNVLDTLVITFVSLSDLLFVVNFSTLTSCHILVSNGDGA